MRAVHVLFGALAATSALALLPALAPDPGGALLASVAGAVAGGVVLGRLRADALALGALATLAACGAFGLPAVLGGGLGLALLHGARIRRARHPLGGVMVGALAFCGGAAAIALVHRYSDAGMERELSAFVVAAAMTAVPFAVPTDDEITFDFRRALVGTKGARRRRLLRAIVVRRQAPRRSGALEAAWVGMPSILARASDGVGSSRLRALVRAERAARALERAELAIGSAPAPFDAEQQLAAELEAIRELEH